MRPAPQQPVEEIARSLILSVAGEIEAEMMKGELLRDIRPRILARYRPTWIRWHGHEAAAYAERWLDTLGPAAILTPYGRDLAGLGAENPSRRNARPAPSRRNRRRPPSRRFWRWLLIRLLRRL